jgi:hypothetical protein
MVALHARKSLCSRAAGKFRGFGAKREAPGDSGSFNLARNRAELPESCTEGRRAKLRVAAATLEPQLPAWSWGVAEGAKGRPLAGGGAWERAAAGTATFCEKLVPIREDIVALA